MIERHIFKCYCVIYDNSTLSNKTPTLNLKDTYGSYQSSFCVANIFKGLIRNKLYYDRISRINRQEIFPDDQNKFLNIDSKISLINNSKNSIYVLDNMETIDMLT